MARRARAHPALDRRSTSYGHRPHVGRGKTSSTSAPPSHIVAGQDAVDGQLSGVRPRGRRARQRHRRQTIKRLARELAAAPPPCVYGRIGTTTEEFGTLASWLVDVVNTVTGNLDKPGGAMWAKPATGGNTTRARRGRAAPCGWGGERAACGAARDHGEFPSVAPWPRRSTRRGRARYEPCVCLSGNPVCRPEGDSARRRPRAARLHARRGHLRQRDQPPRRRHPPGVEPPPARPLRRALLPVLPAQRRQLLPPIFPLERRPPDEWKVCARLAIVPRVRGPTPTPPIVDDMLIGGR